MSLSNFISSAEEHFRQMERQRTQADFHQHMQNQFNPYLQQQLGQAQMRNDLNVVMSAGGSGAYAGGGGGAALASAPVRHDPYSPHDTTNQLLLLTTTEE